MTDYFSCGNGIMIASDVFQRVFSELYLDLLNENFDPCTKSGKAKAAKIFMQAMAAYTCVAQGWEYFDEYGKPIPEKTEEEKTEEINNI